MLKTIDDYLNSVTMYRLIIYYLGALLIIAALLGYLGILPYNPATILFSVGFLIAACWVINTIFARILKITTNNESYFISALILALIITPPKDSSSIPVLFWAAVLTMASKYIVTLNKKHLFNPVALSVFLTGIFINGSASWWIGTPAIMIPVILGGILIVRKIKRWDLVLGFLIAAFLTVISFTIVNGSDLFSTLEKTILYSPLFFFAFVMLTEPLTTPPTRIKRIIYGGLTGFFFAPQFHIGNFYTTPEIALLMGNSFSYFMSPKHRYMLRLIDKVELSPDIYDFLFLSDRSLVFTPGQYLEWTLGHNDPDSRGNRRYFTIASAPEESTVRMGVKFNKDSSSYKHALLSLNKGDVISASQLAGDFTLPKDKNKKLVFIAGGIGITPFRSMIEHLLKKGEQRTITLFYANKYREDIVYHEVFHEARQKLGINTIYTLTDTDHLPSDWNGEKGRVDSEMIRKYVPDFMERYFYLSGPHNMVEGYKAVLNNMGIPADQIITDYFPGFA